VINPIIIFGSQNGNNDQNETRRDSYVFLRKTLSNFPNGESIVFPRHDLKPTIFFTMLNDVKWIES